MKKIKAEFVPFEDHVPQISSCKEFEFEDKIFKANKPELIIKQKLWKYANKNNLALVSYNIVK